MLNPVTNTHSVTNNLRQPFQLLPLIVLPLNGSNKPLNHPFRLPNIPIYTQSNLLPNIVQPPIAIDLLLTHRDQIPRRLHLIPLSYKRVPIRRSGFSHSTQQRIMKIHQTLIPIIQLPHRDIIPAHHIIRLTYGVQHP